MSSILKRRAYRSAADWAWGPIGALRRHPESAPETRILVLLPDGPQAGGLVRWAARLAHAGGGAFWCAHPAASPASTEPDRNSDLAAAFRLADELGGRHVDLEADVLFDGVYRFVLQRRITQVVVGKPRGVPLDAFLKATLPREFVAEDDGPGIVVVSEPADDRC